MTDVPATIGDLRRSEYRVLPVKAELRRNLIRKLSAGEELFPGIRGYDDSVIPQIENAVLGGQDIVLLGERGQAKSRLIRSLISLLDDAIPAIAGCEINDDPYAPICRRCRDLVASEGDATPLTWLTPEQRYSEKLATPDTSIADLIGEVDPIRVAEGRYLSDELTIHYGLVPRTNRGIFAINELPDLAERIQVGLLNIIEERDVQIRGYRLRLPLDVYVVATANPEDYTNRGRIITPLKDRFGAQVRTHYPRTLDDEMAIAEQERTTFDDMPVPVTVPSFMREVVAEMSHVARRHPQVNQRSGVSVRVSTANYENLVSNALRRALRTGEREAVARMSDLPSLMASTAGKIELETWEDSDDSAVLEKIVKTACNNVFRRHFSVQEFTDMVQRFDRGGFTVETGDMLPVSAYAQAVTELPGIDRARQKLGEESGDAMRVAVLEFILEGLHLGKRLNKTALDGSAVYGG
ncbi:MAG: magnesium chelatase [Candidatus Dormibacteraeota bacterium]|nr:magnesium chelatase [Candidatus Dormibacteraeota bacterium]MBV9524701.1 magnesium chelatase [Candidatus Dormibacteraeota bacterium]